MVLLPRMNMIACREFFNMLTCNLSTSVSDGSHPYFPTIRESQGCMNMGKDLLYKRHMKWLSPDFDKTTKQRPFTMNALSPVFGLIVHLSTVRLLKSTTSKRFTTWAKGFFPDDTKFFKRPKKLSKWKAEQLSRHLYLLASSDKWISERTLYTRNSLPYSSAPRLTK